VPENPNNKAGYRPDDAADAWKRTVKFLAETLENKHSAFSTQHLAMHSLFLLQASPMDSDGKVLNAKC
jgi:hypothetical protein